MNHERKENPGVGGHGDETEQASSNLFSNYKKYTALTEQERTEIYNYCIDGLYIVRVLLDDFAENGLQSARTLALMYALDNPEPPTYANTKNWLSEVCDSVCKCDSPFGIHDYLMRTEKAIKARLAVMKYE